MADLSPQEVRSMAQAIGIPITEADLPEVTHRLNAILEQLSSLQLPDNGPLSHSGIEVG